MHARYPGVGRLFWLLALPRLIVGLLAAEGEELLQDPQFRAGFVLLAPKLGVPELARIERGGARSEPVWELAQWHSRYPLTNAVHLASGGLILSNVARWFGLDQAAQGRAVLTFGVDSRPEYGGEPRRSAQEPWVHLLLQQAIQGAPSVAETTSLRLRFDVRLRDAETFRPDGYSPGLHAAQFQAVLTVNNSRRDSPGYGDYLWFVAPVYDDRHELPPEYVAQDFAVTHGKLIYNPGGAALGLRPMRTDEWQAVDCDVRPWVGRALETAWAKGYLRDSRDLADYRVAHINLGWEVPGLNRVTMQVRGLSLRAASSGAAR